jgi:single-strand DNA-binding protein
MASLAKITLVGNLGRDAELRYTPKQTPLLEFSLATNERWNDSSGQTHEHTQWFRCTLWGRQAESLKQYLLKGKQVYVDGKLRVRDYETKEGEKRYSLDVRVDTLQLLGGGGGGGGYGSSGGQGSGGGGSQGGGGGAPPDDPAYGDEDIPF